MSKLYPIERSPLYKMCNRRTLANLLCLPTKYFSYEHEYQYNEFSKPKPNGNGRRDFTVPSDELKAIQKRICRLLSRIVTPEWVMSGKKHCSYITNAEYHVDKKFVRTMDVSKFYDSVQRNYIFKMFKNTFQMAEDIAWLMTDIVTYKGVLPTGSPSSQLIVYWTYAEMFDAIKRKADENDCDFTLYVDDMTFSADHPISTEFRNEIAIQLKKNGLLAKAQKDHYYQPGSFKVVTGVGIENGEKKVLNNKRQKILFQYEKCKKTCNLYDIEKLNGMLCSMRQIEPDIFPELGNYIKHYEAELKEMARKRFYANKRKKAKVKEKNYA